MKNNKKLHIRYSFLFALLAVSFFATLLLAGTFLKMRSSVNHAYAVQQQCAFLTTLAIFPEGNDIEYPFVISNARKDWLSDIPEITEGILSVRVSYDISDTTPYCQVQYCYGDLAQMQFPLIDGTKMKAGQNGKELYIGVSYLPYVRRTTQGECLNINGEWIPVTGVLDDITGKKEDDRLIVTGGDYQKEIGQLISLGQVRFYYYINKYGERKEFKEFWAFLDWLKNSGEEFEMGEPCIGDPWEPDYISDNSILLIFVKKASCLIFGSCIVSCLLILSVYIRKRKDDFLIRRMLGMTYGQLALTAGRDYLMILFPAAVLIGFYYRQPLQLLAAGGLLLLIFDAASLFIIRGMLRREGGYL